MTEPNVVALSVNGFPDSGSDRPRRQRRVVRSGRATENDLRADLAKLGVKH